MKLHEFRSKRLFAKAGVPIPEGEVANSPQQAYEIAARLGGPVVVKAQVLVGGRGKAGGIKLAKSADEAEERAREILGMKIKGLPVKYVLVDQAADIREELYLGVVLDRAARRVAVMASAAGGVDIEQVAAETPEKIVTIRVDPMLGLTDYQARELAYGIGLNTKQQMRQFGGIVNGLYQTFLDTDANLAEINPLAVVGDDGALLALDGKIVLDDNALFRHPDLAQLRDEAEETEAEREARQSDLSYVDLDGRIGCMVNGAGLAMATMDVIKLFGGEPANFLDIGGGARADKVATAMRIILSDPKVRVVLINIFGGITRGDEVANGIVQAIEEVQPSVPFVARVVGTNAEEAREILEAAHMTTADTLAGAAKTAVRMASAA